MNRIAGSFRDPSGYVFQRGGQIYRAITTPCHSLLRQERNTRLLTRLMDQKAVVRTSFVEDSQLLEELTREHPGFEHFLSHERVDPITYPYEWTVSMLADAGLHTLRLQKQLL